MLNQLIRKLCYFGNVIIVLMVCYWAPPWFISVQFINSQFTSPIIILTTYTRLRLSLSNGLFSQRVPMNSLSASLVSSKRVTCPARVIQLHLTTLPAIGEACQYVFFPILFDTF